jgi:hypothetical protein
LEPTSTLNVMSTPCQLHGTLQCNARCQLRSWTAAQANKEKKETISLVKTLSH